MKRKARAQSRRNLPFRSSMLVGLLAMSLSGCASVPMPGAGEVEFEAVNYALRSMDYPSGLRVAVEHDPTSEYVTIATVVGVGGAEDPEQLPGLAHLVEHMAFRARPTGEASVAEQLEWLGAQYNASTGLELTTYHTSAPASAVAELLQLEAYRLFSPLAGSSEAEFDIERNVVISEIRQRNESGFISDILGAMQSALFSDAHPYRQSVGGSEDSLQRMSLDDALKLAEQHYQPDNTTIVISGNIDLEAADALIQQTFPPALLGAGGRPESQSGPRRNEPEVLPELTEKGAESPVLVPAAVDDPELWIGWSIPGESPQMQLLLPYIESVLQQNIRRAVDNDEDVLSVSVHSVVAQRASLILARLRVAEGAEMVSTARKALDQLHILSDLAGSKVEGLMLETELGRLRRQAVVAWLLASEQPVVRTLARAHALHLYGDASVLSKRAEDIGRTDPVSAFEFAHNYLTRGRARFVHAFPKHVAVSNLEEGRHLAPHRGNHELRAPTLNTEAQSRPEWQDSQALTRTLDNGLRVIIVPHGQHPTAHLRLAMPGGQAAGEEAATALLADVFYERNREYHGSLARDYGGQSRLSSGVDHTLYHAAAGAGNVGNMIAIAAESVRFPALYRAEAGSFKRSDRLARQTKIFQRPKHQAESAALRELFGEHVYGRSIDADSLTKFKNTELSRWQSRVFQPQGSTLVIVGAIDPARTFKYVREHFGVWKNDLGAKNWQVPKLPPAQARTGDIPAVKVVDDRLSQDQLTLLCHVATPALEDLASAEVLSAGLQDLLGRQLRQAWGSSYGVSADARGLSGAVSVIELSFAVDSARYADARALLESFLDEPDALADENQLAWARWRAVTQTRQRMRSAAGRGHLLSELAILGHHNTSEADSSLLEALLRVEAPPVRQMLKQCHASAVLRIIGPTG